MTIEGSDWYVLGGATVGGALLGALGHWALSADDGRGDVLSKRFRLKGNTGDVADAAVVADFGRGGFAVEVYHPTEEGIGISRSEEVFRDAADAASFLDRRMDELGFEPTGPWSCEPLDEIERPAAVAGGKRRRR